MDFIGLDIGSSLIKVAQVAHQGGKFRLLALGKANTPHPGLTSEAAKDHVAVAEVIKKLLADLRIKTQNVVVALPESKITSRVVKMPLMTDEELISSLEYEADAFVPFPINDAVLRHQLVRRDEKNKVCEVLLVAAPKRLVNKYINLLKLAELRPLVLETEILSLNRALTTAKSPNTMIVDFGFHSCNFAISCCGNILLTRSFPIAGEALTKALAIELKVDPSQAEEYKKAYGLSEEVLEGKIKKVLTPLIQSVTKEMKKAIQYFEQEEKEAVKLNILAGGSADLPNVASDITAALGIETQIANPFALLEFDQKIFAEFLDDGPIYSVVIGLAKRIV